MNIHIGNYSTLKEDPEGLSKLIDKYVKVQLIKSCSFEGFVHSIDPISFSIILCVPQEETYQTTLIPGHAIIDVAETNPSAAIKPPQRITTVNEEDVLAKKKRLVAWFKKNLLPVTEQGENIVVQNISVLPPYNTTDLCTDNAIVAMQIKKIMDMIPKDFQISEK